MPWSVQALGRRLERAGRGLLELVYPSHCAACGDSIDERWLCRSCARALRPLAADRCPCCGSLHARGGVCVACKADARFQGGACAGLYEEGKPLALLIRSLKYRGDRALVRVLGPMLVQASSALPRPEAVTFVPMTRRRQRERGFNQAQLLARAVAQAHDVPLVALLRKRQDTLPQAELAREQRLKNVSHSFCAAPTRLRHVWLVDDVRTTGATLRACAQALKQQGIRRVEVLVLAVAAT